MSVLKTLLDFWEFTLGPSGWAVLTVTLIALAIPICLHIYWFNTAASKVLPSFLLIGPSGSGKTSLLTLFERGSPSLTRTSQAPLSVECSLPVSVSTASGQYRSVNDPGQKYHRNFVLVDTPGHGKLRQHAVENLLKPQHLKGIIFLVDAATLGSADSKESTLAEAAAYLHDILLILQGRAMRAKAAKGGAEMPVLIAANKLDLFTALPTKLVKHNLETEITKLRDSKSKGLMDSGIGMDDADDEREVLGGAGEGKFSFDLMEEYNIPIEIAGSNVLSSDDSTDVKELWNWMGRHL